jgi:hypothetical protein
LSAEFYANPKYENFSRTAMPMWRAAMLGLGGLDAPKTKALYDVVSTSAKEEVAAFGVQFLWGFPGTIR